MADDRDDDVEELAPALYIEHPVTQARKTALRRKYPLHRFIDVRFAPPKSEMGKDDAIDMHSKPKAEPKGKGKAAETAGS